ncbi:hypothetical protein J2S74_001921 [Evansella vedderi]|uniref:Uncharacterized protein n=1 Tax=Evansella vedderi TaxID=38282 RepID=A0ABT9ZTH8_9BACI|nr:hypothetical protein [Evansella vedderi]MDQ0254542.1 hypothetical protein [Evansella vedderi]
MTGGIFFGLIVVPSSILGLGLLCYFITGKQEAQAEQASKKVEKQTS